LPVKKELELTIMIATPGKPIEEASLYRPSGSLSIISEIFEKPTPKRLRPIMEENGILPDHQLRISRKTLYHRTSTQI
jgi:hypothetical protein